MHAETLEQENARLRRWLRLSVRERLVEYLLLMAAARRSRRFRPPVRSAIAEAIGVGREAVCREMARLEREGLVQQRRREGHERMEVLSVVLAPGLGV